MGFCFERISHRCHLVPRSHSFGRGRSGFKICSVARAHRDQPAGSRSLPVSSELLGHGNNYYATSRRVAINPRLPQQNVHRHLLHTRLCPTWVRWNKVEERFRFQWNSTDRLEPETIDPKVLDVNYLASKLSIGSYFIMRTTCFLISGIYTLRLLFHNIGNKLRTQSCVFETCVAITVSPFLGVISHPRVLFRTVYNAAFYSE